MRIAVVSTILHYPWGGADVLWTRLAAAALAQGDSLLLAVSPAVAAHPRVAALQASGALIHRRDRFTQQRGRRDRWRQAAQRLLRSPHSLTAALDTFRPEVVVLAQGGVFDFLIENGLRSWLAEAGCAFALICQSNDERDRLAPHDQVMATAFIAQAKSVIFVSTHNRDLATRQIGASIPNARVVPNPLELSPADALPWPSEPVPHFAVVSRLEADPKGLDILLDAIAAVASPTRFLVDLYGRGADEPALRARTSALGLDRQVRFRGYEPEVRKIWADHHCMILPSRREGCALAMLEALACGRPVIATDVGGVGDWIEPGVNGFICPPGDARALANVLGHALARQSAWPAMGGHAARLVQPLFAARPEHASLELIRCT